MEGGLLSSLLCEEEPACRLTFRMCRSAGRVGRALALPLGHQSHSSHCHLICKLWTKHPVTQGECVPPSQGPVVAQKIWDFPKGSALAFPRLQVRTDCSRHSYPRAECLQIPLCAHSRNWTSESLHPSGAQHLPLLPWEPRSLLVAGKSSTALAAERLWSCPRILLWHHVPHQGQRLLSHPLCQACQLTPWCFIIFAWLFLASWIIPKVMPLFSNGCWDLFAEQWVNQT